LAWLHFVSLKFHLISVLYHIINSVKETYKSRKLKAVRHPSEVKLWEKIF
jgi:hypothetical protein